VITLISALYIIGIIVFVISVVAGLFSGSFTSFIVALGGGITSAVTFFALAKILENQENILYKLNSDLATRSDLLAKKICQKCNYKYEGDYSSCPHCGYREK